MNAKLDAIIFATDTADNRMIGLERKSEAQAQNLYRELESVEADVEEHIERTT